MTAELILSLAAVVLVLIWAAVLGRLGVLTSPDVRVWQRLTELRGLAPRRSRVQRAAARISMVQRLQEELDLERLLAIAQRDETPASFIAATIFIATAAALAAFAALLAARLGGDPGVPVQLAALAPFIAVLLRALHLRRDAARVQRQVDRTLGDMMMLVGVVTDGRGLQLDDAIAMLSRCASTDALARLHGGGWRRLLRRAPPSTLARYRAMASAFGIPAYAAVADALESTHAGLSERDTYTRVAESVYARRLASARERAARLRILVTLPVAAMLVPLLLLLGAPAFASISAGLGQ
ncbi:MAG: hypothetical protein ACYDAC_08280 [Candidatus Dormibacteria bacterium]